MNVLFVVVRYPCKNYTVDPDGCVWFAAVRLTDADTAAASHFVAFLPMSCIRVQ
jgi:hypothetical protein